MALVILEVDVNTRVSHHGCIVVILEVTFATGF